MNSHHLLKAHALSSLGLGSHIYPCLKHSLNHSSCTQPELTINKINQWVSGAQFYDTSSVYCIVCSSPQVKSPSITIYPPYTLFCPPTPFPSGNHHTFVCIYKGFFCLFVFLLNPFTFFTDPCNHFPL